MKNYFRFMASTTGRWTRALIGFALMAWGYNYAEGGSYLLIGLGLAVILFAMVDWCIFAPLFGYPLRGRKIIDRYGPQGEAGEA